MRTRLTLEERVSPVVWSRHRIPGQRFMILIRQLQRRQLVVQSRQSVGITI